MNQRYSAGNIASVVGLIVIPASYVYLRFGIYESFGMWPMIVLIVLGLGTGVWWIIDVMWHIRHRDELSAFAERHGWEYAERTSDYLQDFHAFPFGVGDQREHLDLLRGDFQGLRCATFTRRFDSGGERGTAQETYTVTLVELPVALPTVDIVPEGTLDRVAKLLGGTDIDFESAIFNRRWRVKSKDTRFAHALLTPRMIHRLNGADVHGCAIRFEGHAVMMWQADRMGTDSLARRLNILTSLATLVPPHLEREYREIEQAQRRASQGFKLGHQGGPGDSDGPLWATMPGALSSGYSVAEGLRGDPGENYPEHRS